LRAVVAAELEIPGADETPGSAWWVEPDTEPAAVFGLYQQEIEHANRIIAATPLDQAPLAGRPSSSASSGWRTCGLSCSTRSGKPRVMPGTSTPRGNYSTGVAGWSSSKRRPGPVATAGQPCMAVA
jgi:hypothetical protein